MAGGDYTLKELLDLSLGTPEIGAVNFNILHRLLNAVLTRLDINEFRVHVDGVFDLKLPIQAEGQAKPTATVKSTRPLGYPYPPVNGKPDPIS